MPPYVSLFRAINVGGKNMVKMDALRQLHESVGFENVRHLLQTGNIVFQAPTSNTKKLEEKIESAMIQRVGFRVDVLVRTADEFKEIVSRNPFYGDKSKEVKWNVILFLKQAPTTAGLDALREANVGPEEFQPIGRELHVYYTNGVGRSKFTNALIERKLNVSSTGRNWNTITKLASMLNA